MIYSVLLVLVSLQVFNCSWGWEYICDEKHFKCIVAGDNYNGGVYHQDANGRDNAKWLFSSTGQSNSYYICDMKHGKCLVAGDNYDGDVYHQDTNGRDNAKWYKNGDYICDYKHHKCLVAGDNADNNIYHQDPAGRLNAKWFYILAVPTSNPTSAPTNDPTPSPTDQPTFIPTNNPTNAPTTVPTMEPTFIPTYYPTILPSNFPTLSPTTATNNPSLIPTKNPAIALIILPTASPTFTNDAEAMESTIEVDAQTIEEGPLDFLGFDVFVQYILIIGVLVIVIVLIIGITIGCMLKMKQTKNVMENTDGIKGSTVSAQEGFAGANTTTSIANSNGTTIELIHNSNHKQNKAVGIQRVKSYGSDGDNNVDSGNGSNDGLEEMYDANKSLYTVSGVQSVENNVTIGESSESMEDEELFDNYNGATTVGTSNNSNHTYR